MLATWAKDLNSSAQRIRILDEATKRAAFWDAWSKTMVTVDPQIDHSVLACKVKAEIIAAGESVEKAFRVLAAERATEAHEIREHQRSQGSISWIRRWLLLYKPPRARAWIPRVFFYIYLVYTPFFPFIEDRGSGERVTAVLGGVLMIAIFRALSYWAERPRAVSQTP